MKYKVETWSEVQSRVCSLILGLKFGADFSEILEWLFGLNLIMFWYVTIHNHFKVRNIVFILCVTWYKTVNTFYANNLMTVEPKQIAAISQTIENYTKPGKQGIMGQLNLSCNPNEHWIGTWMYKYSF